MNWAEAFLYSVIAVCSTVVVFCVFLMVATWRKRIVINIDKKINVNVDTDDDRRT